MLAGAYARYDAMRVADKTAHQAVPAMRSQAVATIAMSRKEAFRDQVTAMSKNPTEHETLCREASRIGRPAYHPQYMIQHGLDSFMPQGAGNGLKSDFDGDRAWKEVFATYLRCRR